MFRSSFTNSNSVVRSPNFGNGMTRSGNTPVKATVVMGCIGPYKEATKPRSPMHPITSLYRGIIATRSPITKIGTTSFTIRVVRFIDFLRVHKVMGGN